uniref:Uncharacterized protein n=1 Tax=Tetradesmus obliquus TaxID=3088 RepID=A0A383W6U1_TETOB|eukprot:jgi/Sobl393_1/12423/SZX72930.1
MLTTLCLDECVLDCAVDSSWQLPQLRRLAVSEWQGAGFKPQLIARMPQLQQLKLSIEVNDNPARGISELVAVLPGLQQLQRLQLYGMQYWPEVAAAADAALAASTAAAGAALDAATAAAAADSCAALTASTQLTALCLEDCWLPVGAVGRMFPASRRLPFLQVLDIGGCEGFLQDIDFRASPQQLSEISRCCLVIKPRQLAQLDTPLRVCLQLQEKCRHSFQGLAMMCKHAQQQAAGMKQELALTGQVLQYRTAQLQEVQLQLADSQVQLAVAQQQLLQQEQQLAVQQHELHELQDLAPIRSMIVATAQQVAQQMQQQQQQQDQWPLG